MKAVFEIAFLDGELEVDEADVEIVVPLLSDQVIEGHGIQTTFSMKNCIRFYKTDKTRDDGRPIFRPKTEEIVMRE